MATLIKTDGSRIGIQPENGTDFQLSELQKYVGGFIETVNLKNGDILVVNEEGKFCCERNEAATEIAHSFEAIFPSDFISGDVVLCKDEEVL